MFQRLKSEALDKWDGVTERLRMKVREKAIENTKIRILLNQKKVEDFTEDELEFIVKEEEDKIKGNFKTKGIYALLAMLGIGII